MTKFLSNKIVASSDSDAPPDAQYVIIRAADYPEDARMARTTYVSTVHAAVAHARQGSFQHSGTPAGGYVGVELNRLREVKPEWCITEDQLLAQYESMQREDGKGPLKLDLRMDPALLDTAKKLWSEKLAQKK